MAANNLVPTPRVDKNGRTVTRHMKPTGTPSSARSFPAPVPVPVENDMEQMVLEVIEVIGSKVEGETKKVFEVDKYNLLYSDQLSHEHVARLHGLVSYFDGADNNRFFKEFIDYVTPFDEEATEILGNYREYLWKHPEDTEAVVMMHRALRKHGVPSGQNGWYSTLDEHLQAQSHYTQQYRAQHGVSMMLHYLENPVYMHIVERHADKLPELLSYRNLRGIVLTEDKKDGFDEDDFKTYLSHGPVGDGYL